MRCALTILLAAAVLVAVVHGGVDVDVQAVPSPAGVRAPNGNVLLTAAQERIASLLDKLRSEQWKDDTEYTPRWIFPPLEWAHQKGLWPSFVHLNFHGEPGFTEMREKLVFPDSNGFVTMFICQVLLESHQRGAVHISDSDIAAALAAVSSHRDSNADAGSTGVEGTGMLYNFWPQFLVNGTWVAEPENIQIPLGLYGGFVHVLERFAKTLHVEGLFNKIKPALESLIGLASAFQIPADNDDTNVAMALGGLLEGMKADYPESARAWDHDNTDYAFVLEQLKASAYRPFSGDEDVNIIDPRSYFYLHDFLTSIDGDDRGDVAIVTTWLETVRTSSERYKSGRKMPFNVNNVDASVCANTLFGITSAVLYRPDTMMPLLRADADVQRIFLSTARMLVHVLEKSLLNERPDLVLLYYPPIYDLYWFVARCASLLTSPPGGSLPADIPVLTEVRDLLSKAMRDHGTAQLLKAGQTDGREGTVFWEDFLGNADTIALKIPRRRHEDRAFSTAVALNALLDTWTVRLESGKWVLDDATPDHVREVIDAGMAHMLNDNGRGPRENAFFSASVKAVDDLPFWYPANVVTDVFTKEKVACDGSPSSTTVFGVRGVMDQAAWEERLKGKCFGRSVPDRPDPNSTVFPYWSSPSLTDAVEMLALSKYVSLQH